MTWQILLGGPTAAGKSVLALSLAREMGAEIVSMDAFQIYRGLDIGTGKATPEEMVTVPHHLIDIAGPMESFSVADYLKKAAEVVRDLETRKVSSIWVGGTGLYFRALRQGITQAPGTPTALAEHLEHIPLEQLVDEVRRVDSEWAKTADLANPRRVQRAVAVFRMTGIPLSEWHARRAQALLPQARAFFVEMSLSCVRGCIEKRVRGMFKDGWVEEVRKLAELPRWEFSQSAQALGYREILSLIRGEISEEDCRERIILQTSQYAKRQLTWFRREASIYALSVNNVDDLQQVRLRLAGELHRRVSGADGSAG